MNLDTVSTLLNISAVFSVFIVSWIGVYLYAKIALKRGVLSNPNYRTLHESPIPRGGGIVFSIVFIVSLFLFWYIGQLPDNLLLIFGVGGLIAALFGFLDDIKNIRASKKLIIQFLLGTWVVYSLDGGPLLSIGWVSFLVAISTTVLFLVWMINAYNFMDGIDGMASSGAIFVSSVMTLVLFLTGGSLELIVIFMLLLASVSAFIFFNWPPASIFMGDSGSIFLGYIFGSLILITVESGDISIWSWLIVFGYFFADTTVTQIMRVILVKKWYQVHRSHAYQNLARITKSHLKVTGGVMLYNIFWIFPLTLWSALQPETALFAVVLAITPGLIVSYKYGPVLSSS
jgi:Fuc2NAc and GlcNAc transferase